MFAFTLLAISSLFMGGESAFLDRVEALLHKDGLFLDRGSDSTTVSSAATGFGVMALAEGASRGIRDRDEVSVIVRKAFNRTTQANPVRNRGWLYHFTDTDGNPKLRSEVSTIDTAIFYSGMLRAAELLKDDALRADVQASLDKIDRDLVLRDGVFLHGFYWTEEACGVSSDSTISSTCEPVLLPYRWDDSSEGLILYRLFDMKFPLNVTRLDYPLFVYAYPLVFYDAPEYEDLLQGAIRDQISKFGYWGITSTDGPTGYVTFNSDTISPILMSAISTKFPQYLDPIKSLSITDSAVSMHIPTGWVSHDELTIDLASAYILSAKWSHENPTTRFVSKNHPAVQ